jgi:putative membrane protein
MNSEASTPQTPINTNQLALDRTWLAHDRTLMAWTRTATSMIGFGFTIYKFFEFETQREASHGKLTPRDFALIIISIGVFSLASAIFAYRREVHLLSLQSHSKHHSSVQSVAWVICLFGIFVLLAAWFRS